ncbi:lambda-exonuclease family protein [Bacillus sp. SM2101]|uniref:YqaJ viral recombinase family nuclease n=1 Tax=Bacillus sp. SM2101 TaxID=2805366 RepID=UPI001BDEA03D|nr:YqaJ viral recombinase family protein [Bacillus sp. SM2101]
MDYKILIWKHNLSNDEVFLWRNKGIGGSDINALLGLDKGKSKEMLFKEKSGQKVRTSNDYFKFHMRVKSFIAEEFKERTGMKLHRRNAILQNKKYPFLIANVDRFIVGQNAGLLCKATSNKNYMFKKDLVQSLNLQCQHYMAVTGAKRWWVALLIGGVNFHYFYVDRNEEVIKVIIEKCEEFWHDKMGQISKS